MEGQTALLAAIMAGVVATTVTILIEKYGGVLGGILGTIPTTIIPAAIGMGSEGGEDSLILSLAIVPAGMLINAIFLSIWAILPNKLPITWSSNKRLVVTSICSLIVWISAGIVAIQAVDVAIEKNYSAYQIAITGFILVGTLGASMCWNLKPAPKGKNQVSKIILVSRGFVAATAIGIAVIISGLGMPLLAGLASVFPAIFLTSMVALWLAQGPSVPLGAAGPMMMGGASVAAYSIIAMWSMIEYGLAMGSVIAWVGSIILWSIPSFAYVNWRSKVEKFDGAT
ncbi:MAG: hypothetical protein OR994_04150 [Candidatus Poseidoniales archaeon]|jgi:hypothetical protein|nr:hypothetical protein [Candidatus Poseidoniales archaeon]